MVFFFTILFFRGFSSESLELDEESDFCFVFFEFFFCLVNVSFIDTFSAQNLLDNSEQVIELSNKFCAELIHNSNLSTNPYVFLSEPIKLSKFNNDDINKKSDSVKQNSSSAQDSFMSNYKLTMCTDERTQLINNNYGESEGPFKGPCYEESIKSTTEYTEDYTEYNDSFETDSNNDYNEDSESNYAEYVRKNNYVTNYLSEDEESNNYIQVNNIEQDNESDYSNQTGATINSDLTVESANDNIPDVMPLVITKQDIDEAIRDVISESFDDIQNFNDIEKKVKCNSKPSLLDYLFSSLW